MNCSSPPAQQPTQPRPASRPSPPIPPPSPPTPWSPVATSTSATPTAQGAHSTDARPHSPPSAANPPAPRPRSSNSPADSREWPRTPARSQTGQRCSRIRLCLCTSTMSSSMPTISPRHQTPAPATVKRRSSASSPSGHDVSTSVNGAPRRGHGSRRSRGQRVLRRSPEDDADELTSHPISTGISRPTVSWSAGWARLPNPARRLSVSGSIGEPAVLSRLAGQGNFGSVVICGREGI